MGGLARVRQAATALSPKQYEIVEVRTSRGMNRALLFWKAILLAEWEANAPYASDGNQARAMAGPIESGNPAADRCDIERAGYSIARK
jgi:hypothetical protein